MHIEDKDFPQKPRCNIDEINAHTAAQIYLDSPRHDRDAFLRALNDLAKIDAYVREVQGTNRKLGKHLTLVWSRK